MLQDNLAKDRRFLIVLTATRQLDYRICPLALETQCACRMAACRVGYSGYSVDLFPTGMHTIPVMETQDGWGPRSGILVQHRACSTYFKLEAYSPISCNS